MIECGSTLYVGLAHAALPTQYKAFMAFSPNWRPEGSTLTYTCKEEQISSPGYLASDRQHAKSRRTEIAFSYDLFIIIIIFFLQTKYLFRWVFSKVFQ